MTREYLQSELTRIAARDRRGRRVRHPLDPRGGVPLGSRRRDEPAARAHHRRHRHRAGRRSAARRCASRPSTSSASPRCARRCTAPRSRGRTSDDRPYARLTTAHASTLPGWLRFVAPVVVGVLIVVALDPLRRRAGDAPADAAEPRRDRQRVRAALGHHLSRTCWSPRRNALVGLVVGSVARDRCSPALAAAVAAHRRDAGARSSPRSPSCRSWRSRPILNTMFGASSQFGRQAVAAIAAFIPVFVNVLRGLRQTRPVHRDLLRASAATGGADLPLAHPADRAAVPDDGPADRRARSP